MRSSGTKANGTNQTVRNSETERNVRNETKAYLILAKNGKERPWNPKNQAKREFSLSYGAEYIYILYGDALASSAFYPMHRFLAYGYFGDTAQHIIPKH